MSTVTGKLITAEEFAEMPDPADGSQQELVRGVIISMPPPGGRHGLCCSRVDRRLGAFVDEHQLGYVLSNDTGLVVERGPDTVRGADVAFWSKERLAEVPDGYIQVPPDLAVEVVSPNDHYSKVQRKVREYVRSGVRLIWVLDPEDRSVTVYGSARRSQLLSETDTLDGEDVVPGFRCKVADLLPP
jgi:Uma2 family endonuclease